MINSLAWCPRTKQSHEKITQQFPPILLLESVHQLQVDNKIYYIYLALVTDARHLAQPKQWMTFHKKFSRNNGPPNFCDSACQQCDVPPSTVVRCVRVFREERENSLLLFSACDTPNRSSNSPSRAWGCIYRFFGKYRVSNLYSLLDASDLSVYVS